MTHTLNLDEIKKDFDNHVGTNNRIIDWINTREKYGKRVRNLGIATGVTLGIALATLGYNWSRIKHPENYVEQTPVVREYIETKENMESASLAYKLMGDNKPGIEEGLDQILKAELASIRANHPEIDEYFNDVVNVEKNARTASLASFGLTAMLYIIFNGYNKYAKNILRKKVDQIVQENK